MSQPTSIDLNLFRVFEVIYRTGGLTTAATELHITQPAVSNALSRLRENFDDPLFVRQGRRVVPTPLAHQLAQEISNAVQVLHDSVLKGQDFDPKTSTRRFLIGMRDPFEIALMPTLMAEIQRQAPLLKVHSNYFVRDQMSRLLSAGDLSLVIDISLPTGNDILKCPLVEDVFCVAMRQGHPLSLQPLTLDRYLAARHITVSNSSSGQSLEKFILSSQGINRVIAMQTQHYFAACQIVAESDLILTLSKAVGHWSSQFFPLTIMELPLKLPAIKVAMYWHKSADSDPGHKWLRLHVERLLKAQFKAAHAVVIE